MKYLMRFILGALILFLIAYNAIVLPLPEGSAAVITHFGKPTRVVRESGPYLKWPWPIDHAYVFDMRNRIDETRFTQTLTRDKKSIILLTYIVWKISDPLKFLVSVGNVEDAYDKISSLVSSTKNSVMGGYNLSNLISTDETQIKFEEIENKILNAVATRASEDFGIDVSTLGIKRLAYPENNVIAILEQMRAERGQFAASYRAEGRKKASIILSETELEIAQIQAEATKEAARIRGEADREAAEIYADTYTKTREFYEFTRSLEVLEKVAGQATTFVFRTDQPPFNLLHERFSSKIIEDKPLNEKHDETK